jgi:filamentous hemagglutinin family protein
MARVGRTVYWGRRILAPALTLVSLTAAAEAQLVGAKVVAGQATITATAQSALIQVQSPKAVITYSSFSIPTNYSVTVQELNATSVLLNKVLGGGVSYIYGSLTANGQVWIVNPAGIVVGSGATINAAGLLLSTIGIGTANFLAGNYSFDRSGAAGAGVVNYGTITATGGYAVLAGEQVSNSGVIVASLGNVVLAGGAKTYAVDFSGDRLLSFAISTPVAQANGTLVSNTGTIGADGGTVLLTAASAKSVLDNVINTSGIIEATSVASVDGKIVLTASGGGTEVSGTLDASGKGAGQTGGEVDVLSDGAVTLASGALVDVSGDAGGGTALIGGNFHGSGPQQNATTTTVAQGSLIDADAISAGNGGHVAVWSNGSTIFNGSITANGGAEGGNGGYVETSGKALTLGLSASVMALAPNGSPGTWLLDPDTLTIGPITIDFTTLPTGAVSTTEYAADGLSSLYLVDDYPSGPIVDAEAQNGDTATPGITNSEFPYGEGGNDDPFYPTYENMVFQFSAPVGGVSFSFDNYGNNGITSYFTVTNGVTSAPINISADSESYSQVNVSGTGFNELVISNGGNDWFFAVSSLSIGGGGAGASGPTSTTGTGIASLIAPPPPAPPVLVTPPAGGSGPPPPPPPPGGSGSTAGGLDDGGTALFGSGGGGTPPEPFSEPPPPFHPAPNPTPIPQTSDSSVGGIGGNLFASHQTFVRRPGQVNGITTQWSSDGNWANYWAAGFQIR